MEKNQKAINWIKQIGSFYLSDYFLGKGEYSTVYLGKSILTGDRVAVKIISRNNFKADTYILMTLIRQYDILKTLHDENIVKFIDLHETSNNWYFVFEFCNQGTLENYLESKGGRVSELKAIYFIKEIINAFKTLQIHKIMHRDIKPANIMISDGVIKVSDFSFGRLLEDPLDKQLNYSLVGTPFYSSLQIISGEEYSSKTDIWSLGVLLYQMIFGEFPFFADKVESGEINNYSLIEFAKIIKVSPLSLEKKDVFVSKQTKLLLIKMLEKDDKKRISWNELFMELKNFDLQSLNRKTGLEDSKFVLKNSIFGKHFTGKLSQNNSGFSFSKVNLEFSQKISKNELVSNEIGKKYILVDENLLVRQKYAKDLKIPIFAESSDLNDTEENIKVRTLYQEKFKNMLNVNSPSSRATNIESCCQIIHFFLLYKKNIANFLGWVSQRLWNIKLGCFKDLSEKAFFSGVFLLTKYECMIYESIYSVLEGFDIEWNVIMVFPLVDFDFKEILKVYRTSEIGIELKNDIKKTIENKKNFFLKKIFNNLITKSQKKKDYFDKDFQKVLNENFEINEDFLDVFVKTQSDLYLILKKKYEEKKEIEILILMKCIVLSFTPFEDFSWDRKMGKPTIEFDDFINQINGKDENELIEFLKGKNIDDVQKKLKRKFVSFLKSQMI